MCHIRGLRGGSVVNNLPANAGDTGETGSIPGSRRARAWKRNWQPTPVFLPGKSHRQESHVGYYFSKSVHTPKKKSERTHQNFYSEWVRKCIFFDGSPLHFLNFVCACVA